MKTFLLVIMVILLISTASAEPADHIITGPSNMPELYQAINNESILSYNNDKYTTHESIEVTTDKFHINNDIIFGTSAFLSFPEKVLLENSTLVGKYSFEKYNLYITDNSLISNASFEDIGILITTDKIINNTLDDDYIIIVEPIIDEFNNDLWIDNTSAVMDTTFTDSYVKIIEYGAVNFSECTFTDTETVLNGNYKVRVRPVSFTSCEFKDEGIQVKYSNIEVYNSSFENCGIGTHKCNTIIDNCTVDNSLISLGSSWGVHTQISNSILTKSEIHITVTASDFEIFNNSISDSEYGIKIGGRARTSTSKMKIFNNDIHVDKIGIWMYGAHANGINSYSYISDNHVQAPISVQLDGYTSFWGTNIFRDNDLTGDVIIDNMRSKFIDNTINGNVTISENIHKIIGNNVSGNITIEDVSTGIFIKDNTAFNLNVIDSTDPGVPWVGNFNNSNNYKWLCSPAVNGGIFIENNTLYELNIDNSNELLLDYCIVGDYNLYNYSEGISVHACTPINVTTDPTIANISAMNSTYEFNGSTCLLHNNLVFSVYEGELSSVNVTGLTGTYDLFYDDDLLLTVNSVEDTCRFEVEMGVGEYLIAEHETTPVATSTQKRRRSSGSSRWTPVIITPTPTAVLTTDATEMQTVEPTATTTLEPTLEIIPEDEPTKQSMIEIVMKWFKSLKWW